VSSRIANAQTDRRTVPLSPGSEILTNSFLFSFDYSTNTNFPGNVDPEIKQPTLSPSVAFFSKSGIDAFVSGNLIGNSDDSLSGYSTELDLVLGYNFYLLENLTIYPAYTRFIYSPNAGIFNSIFRNDFHLDADYTKNFANLGITFGYMTGKQSTFYTSVRNYYLITLDHFLSQSGSLFIQPGIDINFGNYTYLNRVYLDQIRQDLGFYEYLIRNSPELRRYIFREINNNPLLTRQEVLDMVFGALAKDEFKLTSVTLSLPIFFMTGNFGINFGLFVYIPANQPEYLNNKAMFYFNAGVSYNLGLE